MTAAPLDPAWASTAERVFAAVSPSVVVVEAGQQGSGVVVAARVVATNCHVIGEAGRITVRRGRIGHAASLVRSDRDRDVCLLEVPTLEAPSVAMRLAADLRVGAAVYAVGAPQGLELSLSAGLVSQLRGAEGGPLIQTTAPVSPGSSGGGLFDELGALVGLTTLQLGRGQNLNFAVPVEWVASAVNGLFAWRRCRAAPEPRCVIEEALAAARDISEQSSRSRALMSIAVAQAQAGDRQASGRTITSAQIAAREIADLGDRSWVLREITDALARTRDFAGAMVTAPEIAYPIIRSWALSSVAEAQARAGDFPGAVATAREIADPMYRSLALRDIAEALARAGDGRSALEVIDAVSSPAARAHSLAQVASALASARQEPRNER